MLSNPLLSSYKTLLDPLSEAHQRWKVRTRLTHTIQDYVDACNVLDNALSRQSSQVSLEQTLADVDAELSRHERDHRHLSQAHAILSRNRNRSKKLAPINSLPTEILSQIFLFTAFGCIYQPRNTSTWDRNAYPDALAGVCSAWRKTAVNLSSLWSHIDLRLGEGNTESYYHCAKTWSERSINSPIHIHVLSIADPATFEESEVLKLLRFLVPLATSIGSFDMDISHLTEEIGRRILATWATGGYPAVARSLVLLGMDSSLINFQPWGPPDTTPISPREIEEVFSSVQSLSLSGLHIPWESTVYHGLTSLFMEYGTGPGACWATQLQLATVLESSPKLRELKLIGVCVQPGDWTTSKRVALKDLEVLAVHECVSLILPLINPGPKPLRMSFFIEQEPVPLEIIRSFFARSVIDTLHLMSPWGYKAWFSYLLGSLQHLGTLAIAECPFSVPDIQDFLALPSEKRAAPWPKLHTLHLSECIIQDDILLKLLSMHSIQNLYLHSCTTARSLNEPEETEAEMLKLKEWLAGTVSNIVLNDNPHNDPSNHYIS